MLDGGRQGSMDNLNMENGKNCPTGAKCLTYVNLGKQNSSIRKRHPREHRQQCGD